MDYWKIQKELANEENQKVINEYLLKLYHKNLSKVTISRYRSVLQKFFMDQPTLFSMLTDVEIHQWFKEQKWKETTTESYFYHLHSFYQFCMESEYIEALPFETKRRSLETQSVQNPESPKEINEFIKSLRKENKNFGTIIKYQSFLQMFFKSIEKAPSCVTANDIDCWLDEDKKHLSQVTKNGYRRHLRTFFSYLEENGIIDQSPIPVKPFNYWQVNKPVANHVNQEMINEYLQHLKDGENHKQNTIITYRSSLETFFENVEQSFSSLTPETIETLLAVQSESGSKNSYYKCFSALRGFYSYCVENGHMKSSPVKGKVDDTKEYWEVNVPLKNHDNQKVLNEYLAELKNRNRTKGQIIAHRSFLQGFLLELNQSFSSFTTEDMKKWQIQNQKELMDSSINTYITILRSFYRFCVEQEYLEQNPVRFSYRKQEEEKYWVVKEPYINKDNEHVVNEFLLALKVENLSEGTIYYYRNVLELFLKDRETYFKDILQDDIQNWLIQKKAQKSLKESTFSNYLSAISSFYTFCVAEEHLEKSPIKYFWYPRLPKSIPKYLEKGEIAKIRTQSEQGSLRDRALLEFLLTSGCRVGEANKLNRADVDMENRTARVLGKGQKIRDVHFSAKCALLLEAYLESRHDRHPAFFVSKWSTRLSVSRMYEIINELREKAKLQQSLHPHRLRHTFATELLAKGAPLGFISEEMGHSNLQTTQIYARLPKQQIISQYRKYMG